MALNVNQAFNEFNKDIVNLDSDRTKKARGSRDWLIKQLNLFPTKIDNFPPLYVEKHIKFGSFARNTKIEPLDDIDLILTLKAQGSTYLKISENTYDIMVPTNVISLQKLCDNDILNSIKVVNKIVLSLKEIEHYSQAKIHRREESATLLLNSYEWNFDIVPSFYTDQGFYLIPNGQGKWKATNPKIDQDNVSTINQKHNGKILQIIRILKYWQKRGTMPTISSYLFETIILTYFESQSEITDYIDFNLSDFWKYLEDNIYSNFPDPKGFQGELNNLDIDTKQKISKLSKLSYDRAVEAIRFKTNDKDMKKSINKWKEIFGDEFPKYN